MRQVLLLTYHFPPSGASGAFRLLGFARHLPKFGWRTAVVAPPELTWEPVDRGLLAQVPPETDICSVPYPKGAPKAIRWAAPYAVWLPRAFAAAVAQVRRQRPDVVLTSGPPHWIHLLGLFLKRWYRLPWVADFRDPWVSDGNPERRLTWLNRWERVWERQVLRHADTILANAPRATASMQELFPHAADKVFTLTNGYDAESFPPPAPPAPLPRTLHIVHAGQVYAGRDPRPFLDAVRALRADPRLESPFHVTFLGRSIRGGFDLEAEIAQRDLGGVVAFGGQVSYRETLQELAAADVLLLLDSPGRLIGVPAKLYEYLGAGRPVLALAEPAGDVAVVLRESGLPHRVAPPADAAGIQQALLELVNGLAAGRFASPTDAQLYRFTREALAQQLAQTLDECVQPARTAAQVAVRLS